MATEPYETLSDLIEDGPDIELPLYFTTPHGSYQFVATGFEEVHRNGEPVTMVTLQEVEK